MRADIPSGSDPTGFQATEGCWRVDAGAAGARLSFVTLVVKAEPQ